MPDDKTETIPRETDEVTGLGLCTTVTGVVLVDGEPTGDLIFTRRGTSGKIPRSTLMRTQQFLFRLV